MNFFKKKNIYIYDGILLSHTKNEIMPFAATWMQLEIMLSEKSDRERQIYDIAYMCNQKYDTNELIYETERLRCRKQTYGFQGEKGGMG